jgi:hypothetical protein
LRSHAVDDRQLRSVHLQPRAVPAGAGAEVKVVRNDELTVEADRSARAGADRDLAGPCTPERAACPSR